MANMNELILCVKWKPDASGHAPDITTPAGCRWEDITGQPAANLPCAPNVYLIRAFVTDAVYTSLNGNANYIILARRQYDEATPDVYVVNNFDDKPTAAQLTALKNLITTRFPGVDEDKLTDAGQQIFKSGLTRQEIIPILAKRWQQFVKAIT